MNQWLIVPTILPAMAAALLVLALRHNLTAQRAVSVGATAALMLVAIGLYWLARDGEPRPYLLGDWPAPFGIVMLLDRLSATMLLLSSTIALVVLIYAIGGWDTRGRHFHALFQFQLLGINGAFLTGDVFNLFVFFEVMLIASYGLMLHGGGARRLQAGFQYVAINLIASTLFLFAVGLIYSVTGTLNMADLARKLPQVATADQALLTTGAVLLLAVFAIKAALVPLHWWLPATYAAASAPAAALFAILTKVGAYSIIRACSLFFAPNAAIIELATTALIPLALITLVVGAIATLASRTLLDLAGFAVIASMGTLLIPVGLLSEAGNGAAMYYLIHSTAVSAALFLLVDLIAERRGGGAFDRLRPAPLQQPHLMSGLYFLVAIAFVGMPPLSGFVGKLLILDGTRGNDWMGPIWSVVLATSLILIVGFARAGSAVFWRPAPTGEAAPHRPLQAMPVFSLALLIIATALLTVFAGPVTAEMNATARQIGEPDRYVRAVLGPATQRTGAQ